MTVFVRIQFDWKEIYSLDLYSVWRMFKIAWKSSYQNICGCVCVGMFFKIIFCWIIILSGKTSMLIPQILMTWCFYKVTILWIFYETTNQIFTSLKKKILKIESHAARSLNCQNISKTNDDRCNMTACVFLFSWLP